MPDPLLISQHDGFSEWLHTVDGDTFTIERVTDVEPVLDANKRAQNDNPDGMGASREWKHIATIPAIIVLRWIDEYGVDPTAKGNEALLKRLLNDPDWKWLRTGLGRV